MPATTNDQSALPTTTNARNAGSPPPMTSSMKTRISAEATGFATE